MPYLFISICSLNTAFCLLLHVIIHKHHFIDIYWSSTMCWWVFLAIKQSSLKKTLKTKHLVLSMHTYIVGRMCVRLSFQLCPALYDPMDCSPPDSSVHGILQARILEWAASSFSRGFSWVSDCIRISCVFCISRQILYHGTTWGVPVGKTHRTKMKSKSHNIFKGNNCYGENQAGK